MTIAKGLSSGYQPIGGSIVCDEVAKVIAGDEFNHGYTYSSHPVAQPSPMKTCALWKKKTLSAMCATLRLPETEMGGDDRSPHGW